MFYINNSKHKSPFPVALCKEKRWHEKLASAAAAVKGLLKFQIRPMEMCPSGCCCGKSGLLAYSVSSIYISTASGIWSIYSLGYLHNIWWTADTGSGQGDLVHALSDNLHPSSILAPGFWWFMYLNTFTSSICRTTLSLKICTVI